MKFCIEEWSNGWFEPKDLSAGDMLEKYEAHLFGLKEAKAVASSRISDLQEDLYTFAQCVYPLYTIVVTGQATDNYLQGLYACIVVSPERRARTNLPL